MTETLSILVVEDNAALAANIVEYFEQRGHRADYAGDGRRGLLLALEQDYDVMVLDLMLPGLDGGTVCRNLRECSPRHVPVLMLSARDTLADKLEGFAQGADDYLTKPFALEELLARCLSLSRRHLLNQDAVLRIGELRIDRRRRAVSRAGREVEVQPMGYRLLLVLAEAHPRIVTRSELSARLWGEHPQDANVLRSHLYLLRQQLDKPFGHPMLRTLHGVGFQLIASP